MEKILIVDDDTFLLDMYATKFGQAGYVVTTAKSVEVALVTLRGGEIYRIILLDIVMPRLTGIDLLRAIRTEKLSNDPVCIVLSNQGEKSDIEVAQEIGIDGYLIKANLIPSEVVACVKDCVEKKSSGKNK